MGIAETDELVLAELAAGPSDAGTGPPGRSLSALAAALGGPERRLSGGIELATALEDLRSRGLVERLADSSDPDRYVLTTAGEERAADVRETLADAAIDVVDDEGRQRLSLGTATGELGDSLARIAADCTDDGVYYRADDPPAEGLLGRESELDQCRATLERVQRTRRGRGLFLVGPGGIGKTTLAEALLADVGDEFDVLRATCRDESEPFRPVRDLLSGTAAPSPFDDVGSVVDEPAGFRAQRTGLFHDVTAALAPDERDPPRLAFVDELHLADAATLAYLEYLLERLGDHPLVLLGAYRPAGAPDDAPFGRDSAGGDDRVTTVRLPPLDRDGTRRLVERVVGHPRAPDALVDAVHDRTDGTPLFVEETVSRLLETDQLDPRYAWYPEEADAIDVPEAVTETIDRRIADLDPDARELLRWAAVIGERCPVPVLYAVCDLPESRVDALLEATVAADVFAWEDDREVVAFRIEVVREAILGDLPADGRRRRHATVAEALEELDPSVGSTAEGDDGTANEESSDRRAAAIASHLERAGETEAAIRWYRRAAERATDVYAHEAAIEHYHSALALARDGTDAETVLSVAEELATIHVTTGEFDEAERFVTFARERTADDAHARRQRLSLLAARVAMARGAFETVIEHVEDGLALEGEDAAIRCRLLNQRTRAEIELGRLADAEASARRQREIAAAGDEPVHEAKAIQQRGSIGYTRGEYDAARDHLGDALERFRAGGDPTDVAKVRSLLAVIARDEGDLEAATTNFRRALEAYRRAGHRSNVARLQVNLATVASTRGEYERARERLRGAIEEFRAIGDRDMEVMCRHSLGSVALERGEYATATEHLSTALDEARAMEGRRHVVQCRHYLGRLATERGRYDAADEHFRAALEGAEAIGDRRLLVATRVAFGALALARGDHDAAADRLERGLEEVAEIGDRRFGVRARYLLGELAVARGEYDAAEDRFREVLDAAADSGDRHAAARARRALGELAVARGEAETGRERARDALETFDEIGARADALAALEVLVDVALEAGEDEQAREWLERAADRLESVADDERGYEDHREWVADARAALE